MQTSTLRPGILVSLKTQIVGNVKYKKETLQSPKVIDGKEKTSWRTERTIHDPKEFEAAKVTRGKCRTLITSVCAASSFGLLCPEKSATRLEEAIAAARVEAEKFNRKAKLSRVNVYVMSGRIAQNDREAIRAIKSEVRELMTEMQEGVKNLDPKAIRMAANKMRGVGMMLTEDAQEKVKSAINVARLAARKIVKAGEEAAQAVDKEAVKQLATCRTAFLDLEEASTVGEVAAEARAIDLEPEAKPTKKSAKQAQPQLEL